MTTTAHSRSPQGMGGLLTRLRTGLAQGFGVFHPGSRSMVVGGMMLILSAFLPWVYVTLTQPIIGESFALRGTDGPGVVTLSLGFLAFAGGFVPKRRLAIAHAAVPGILAGLIVLAQVWNIISASLLTAWGAFLPGIGVVLVAGGAALLLKVSWTMLRRWKPTAPAA